jgi:hypothetical protein
MLIREVFLKEELTETALLVSSKVGVVRDVRDTARIIHLLGSVAPLDMFGVRSCQLKHASSTPVCGVLEPVMQSKYDYIQEHCI